MLVPGVVGEHGSHGRLVLGPDDDHGTALVDEWTAEKDEAAIDEAVRVLRPGGRLAIGDLLHTNRYRGRLEELGMTDVERRSLGWRMWLGAPFFPTRLVTATKPI